MVTERHGYDRYVTGGVQWEKYSLEQLVKMVEEQASAPELQQLAQDWREAGDQVVSAAGLLGEALNQLMDFWAGTAAEQARHDVELNARWVADLGETAHDIGPSIEEAANALQAVQAAMPELPAEPAVPPALAADSAARGLDAGGPLVSAVNGTAAGTESAFAAEQKTAELKSRAVDAMRRFEGAVIGIDESTPRFAEPAPDTGLVPGEPTPIPTPPPSTTPPPPISTDPVGRWDELTKGDPTTTAQGVGDGGGYAGGYSGGGSAAVPVGADAGRGPLQYGGSVGATEALTGNNPRPAVPAAGMAAAAGGSGGSGAGMGGMPMGGAMGGGQGGEGGADHRRRYPYDGEDPFLLDQKASPPVIGL